jgi:hypothetical protein
MFRRADSKSGPLVWTGPLQELLEGHPLRPSIESYHKQKLRLTIIKACSNFNEKTKSQVDVFGGYLLRLTESEMKLESHTKIIFPNPDNQARRALLYGRKCDNIFPEGCFIPSETDVDLKVQNLEQIEEICELFKSLGLTVRHKKRWQGYDPISVHVKSVVVTVHDLLSGFWASVKVDFVLVIHPALFTVDFDLNDFYLTLGPDKHFPQDMQLMRPEVDSKLLLFIYQHVEFLCSGVPTAGSPCERRSRRQYVTAP